MVVAVLVVVFRMWWWRWGGALTISDTEVNHLEGGVVRLFTSRVGDGAEGSGAGHTHCVVQIVLWQNGEVSRGQELHCTPT